VVIKLDGIITIRAVRVKFLLGNRGVNVLLVAHAESSNLVTSSWLEGCGELGSVKISPIFVSFTEQDKALLNLLSGP
jgi:hypothetical protein